MTLHLHNVGLTEEQLASETLNYGVRLLRTDPASGMRDAIEVNGYGDLEELLEDVTEMLLERRWLK
jgi:hypothetical protein